MEELGTPTYPHPRWSIAPGGKDSTRGEKGGGGLDLRPWVEGGSGGGTTRVELAVRSPTTLPGVVLERGRVGACGCQRWRQIQRQAEMGCDLRHNDGVDFQ